MQLFQVGATVRLKQPEIKGQVVGGTLAESGIEVNYSVEYVSPDGEVHSREFASDDLELVEDVPAPVATV